MKKMMAIFLVAGVLISMGTMAFADGTDTAPAWFNDMMEWRKGQLEDAVDNGQITEEQAESWEQHFDDMEQYHEESGFAFPGGCGSAGRGGFRGASRGGFGPGRMQGGFWNGPSNN